MHQVTKVILGAYKPVWWSSDGLSASGSVPGSGPRVAMPIRAAALRANSTSPVLQQYPRVAANAPRAISAGLLVEKRAILGLSESFSTLIAAGLPYQRTDAAPPLPRRLSLCHSGSSFMFSATASQERRNLLCFHSYTTAFKNPAA